MFNRFIIQPAQSINSTKIGFKLIRNFVLKFSIWDAAVKNV